MVKKGAVIRRSWKIIALAATAIIAIVCAIRSSTEKEGHTHGQVLVDTTGLRNGDLLLRNGLGTESRFVTGLSNGTYSHIALAYNTPNGWHAVHAVPGETENPKDTDFLKSEPIEVFYCYERAQAGAIARVDCSDSIASKALAFALDKVKRRYQFDHKYSLTDTTKYYCTELIYQAYLTEGIDLADDRRHELRMPGTESYFIFPSDILESKHIQGIRQLKTSERQ